MNRENERILARIQREFQRDVDRKYRAGNKEHGDDIMAVDLLKEIKDEAVDLYVYASAEQMKRARRPRNKKKVFK